MIYIKTLYFVTVIISFVAAVLYKIFQTVEERRPLAKKSELLKEITISDVILSFFNATFFIIPIILIWQGLEKYFDMTYLSIYDFNNRYLLYLIFLVCICICFYIFKIVCEADMEENCNTFICNIIVVNIIQACLSLAIGAAIMIVFAGFINFQEVNSIYQNMEFKKQTEEITYLEPFKSEGLSGRYDNQSYFIKIVEDSNSTYKILYITKENDKLQIKNIKYDEKNIDIIENMKETPKIIKTTYAKEYLKTNGEEIRHSEYDKYMIYIPDISSIFAF